MTDLNFTPAIRAYTVGLLTFIYTANYVDRQIVAILLQSIKLDMGLSDTQLGLLSGLAFAIFYATLGIPIAYLADRVSRKKIIIVSLSLFSVMTFICGYAQNFVQLLLARIGVGVGEAGTSPPSHAMIADMYAPNERATPLAIFALGINIGLLIAFLVGGWVNHHYGWRAAFQVVALPGLLLAIIAMFTLRDPPRGLSDGHEAQKAPPLGEVARYILHNKTLRHLIIGSTLIVTVGYGAIAWLPTYFVRVHAMTTIEVGQISGPAHRHWRRHRHGTGRAFCRPARQARCALEFVADYHSGAGRPAIFGGFLSCHRHHMGHCFAGFSGQRRRALFRADTCHVAYIGETRNALARFGDFAVHQQYYRSGFGAAHDRRVERLFFTRLRRARLALCYGMLSASGDMGVVPFMAGGGSLRADIENMGKTA